MSKRLGCLAVVLAGLSSALPAAAEELRADDARQFVAGKMFTYTCFEGTSGAGRIHADGSVVGHIQIRGAAPRFVALPAGTLRVNGSKYCASMRGMPFEPCFNLEKTSANSFRGAISGFGFAYCDFHRRSARADLTHAPLRLRGAQSASVTNEQN